MKGSGGATRSARLLRRAWPLATLAAVLGLAAVLRTHDLVANPPGFFADEASFGYNAWTILHTGRDEHGGFMPLFFRAFGEYKLPVYIYSQVPLVALLGLSELPVRLTTALYGILTVLAVYLFVQELFRDRLIALCSAAVLAILPWHIFYSRTGLGDITSHVFFLFLGLYLFVAGTRRPLLWPLAGLSFMLALFSYRAAWVLLPPILAVLALLYWREVLRHPWHALVGLAFVALAGTAILWQLQTVDSDRARDQWIFALDLGLVETAKRFLSQYGMHFTPEFVFNEERDNLRHVIPGAGWLYYWQAPFIVAGVAALVWRPNREKLLLLALLAIFPLAAAVTISSPDSNRALLGAGVISIVTAYGIVSLGRLVAAWRPAAAPRLGSALVGIGAVCLIAVSAFGLGSFLRVYHGSYQTNAADRHGWQYGARQIIERFLAEEDNYDSLVVDGHGAFNDPAMLIMFYRGDCTTCVLGKWDSAGNPDRYRPGTRQLFAMQPESMVIDYEYKELGTLYYPNGVLAFIFAEIVGKVR